jgi:ketosteroid isomerase-like protein
MAAESDNIASEIGKLYRVFEECLRRQDVPTLLRDFYADPVYFEGTGVPLTVGSAGLKGILDMMVPVIADVRVEQIATQRLGTGGDVVCDFALIHATLKDGNKGTDRGCCVFVKTPKGWRCQVDVFLRP